MWPRRRRRRVFFPPRLVKVRLRPVGPVCARARAPEIGRYRLGPRTNSLPFSVYFVKILVGSRMLPLRSIMPREARVCDFCLIFARTTARIYFIHPLISSERFKYPLSAISIAPRLKILFPRFVHRARSVEQRDCSSPRAKASFVRFVYRICTFYVRDFRISDQRVTRIFSFSRKSIYSIFNV